MFNCHCRIERGQWPAIDPTASGAATFSGDRSWSPDWSWSSDRSWSSDWSWSWSSYRLEATFTWSRSHLGLNTLLTPFFKCQDASIKKTKQVTMCVFALYCTSLLFRAEWPLSSDPIKFWFFFFCILQFMQGVSIDLVLISLWSYFSIHLVSMWSVLILSWSW